MSIQYDDQSISIHTNDEFEILGEEEAGPDLSPLPVKVSSSLLMFHLFLIRVFLK